jgi:hypothetical protein
VWDFDTQKGKAMENTFITWLCAMEAPTYRVKIVTKQRIAEATFDYEKLDEFEQSILRIVQKSWVGSVTLTAPCGCSYIFEKTEHHADHICGTHWVHMVFNGDIDE